MPRTIIRVAAPLALAAMLGVACGDDGSSAAETGQAPETTEAPATDTTHEDMGGGSTDGDPTATPAAELRSGLTALLQEHVYLAGIAINQAVADGGDLEAPATADAVATLDANSVALSEAIASVYGDEGGEQFLALWRAHIGFFVEYTLGGATGDTAAQDAARQQLDDYRADFGAFVDSATGGNLPADAVAAELQVHVDTLITAIDAILAGDPQVYGLLAEAASHMPGTAAALASAIATQMPDTFGS
jgi:hypothetical protein